MRRDVAVQGFLIHIHFGDLVRGELLVEAVVAAPSTVYQKVQVVLAIYFCDRSECLLHIQQVTGHNVERLLTVEDSAEAPDLIPHFCKAPGDALSNSGRRPGDNGLFHVSSSHRKIFSAGR